MIRKNSKFIEYFLLITSISCLFLASAPAKAAKISELVESTSPSLIYEVPSWDGVTPNGTTRRFSIRNLIENTNIVTSNFSSELTIPTLNATDLVISGDSSFGTISVSGLSSLATLTTSGLASMDDVTVVDDLLVGDDVSVTGSLIVIGDSQLSTLTTSGLASLDDATIVDDLLVGDDLTVTGDLNVTGSSTLSSLSVSGLSSLTTITVSGASIVDSLSATSIESLGNLNVFGDTYVTGNVTITGNLSVVGSLVVPGLEVGTANYAELAGTANTLSDISISQFTNDSEYVIGGSSVTFNNIVVTGDIYTTAWQNWSPVFNAGGSMTFTSVSTTGTRYKVVGKTVFFHITANGTGGGTLSNTLIFTLPIQPKTSCAFSGRRISPGGSAYAVCNNSNTEVSVYRYDTSNWESGDVGFDITGFYEID